MSNALVPADKGTAVKAAGSNVANDFVTMTVADQLFGIPVLTVQDVLGPLPAAGFFGEHWELR